MDATAVEFDPFSRDFFDDPYHTYADLRDYAPCYYSEQYDFYALSRFDDVVAGHRDFATFTSTHGQTYEQLASGKPSDMGSIISMDPPEHTRYRKLVSRSFTPRSIGDYEALVREIISGYLDPLMGRRQFDILEEFAAPFPVEIISTILGVPAEDRQQIRLWTDAMLHREEGSAMSSQAAQEGGMAQGMYLFQLSQKKREEPADDMLSALIEAEVETEDGDLTQLDDAEIAGFGTLLAAAGSETVTKLVGNAVVLFHRNPDQWAKVVGDPSLIANAVEEILRYWAPSQYQGRYSVVDSEWHGVTIPKNKPVFLITGAANRDPRRYDDPDKFDITREPGLAVGLGHGLHVCLGAALARLESRVAIEEIARRWPAFEVQESGLRRVQMSNVAGYSSVPITVS
ncbi:MAG: cytochrome P450 [Acidimicrobiia bacterium]|nr:cytochrome P450 [Acidimicrobiia bacterium]MCY4435124.1 cytochrome P450 [bacterium]